MVIPLKFWLPWPVVAAWPVASGIAADIRVEADSSPAKIFVRGWIVDTDLAKMEKVLEDLARTKSKREVVVALNSPGGDHFAGLRLGLLLQRKGVGTVVLPGATCTSACSSMFFGGFDLRQNKPNRTVYEGARLGVHQMRPTGGRALPDSSEDRRVRRAAAEVLTDLKVSKTIQDKLFATPPGEMYFLSPAEMAETEVSFRRGP